MTVSLPSSEDTGALGVPHLKRLWAATVFFGQGSPQGDRGEAELDRILLNALGLGLHQTLQYLFRERPTFESFERWVVATAGAPDPLRVDRLTAFFTRQPCSDKVEDWQRAIQNLDSVLTEQDLVDWKQDGYVLLKGAVAEPQRQAAEQAIWQYVEADPDCPESWYQSSTCHGIMVELIQHAALEINRRSTRIHKAFSQIWGTTDLWVSADRCSFHPPQRDGCPFPGPDLHWDIDFSQPPAFGTQGILYLTDTPPEQGALTLVPGFHERLQEWLSKLPPDADPQQEDLHALGSVAIGGNAGGMIIWHQSLPHGSRPNLGHRPRIVQYINLVPAPGFEPDSNS